MEISQFFRVPRLDHLEWMTGKLFLLHR